jgi:ethanolamine permease
MAAGMVAILSGRTGEIITLSCFGALSLYGLSMVSLLRLRVTEPHLPRPFRTIGYPASPIIALVLAVVSLVSLSWYNAGVALVFAALMCVAAGFYAVVVRPRVHRAAVRA